MTEPALPIVLLPIGTDDAALDACLAALEQGTPAGTRVWLLDDAQAGPRGIAIIERWLDYTQLQAEYSRRPRPIGEAAHLAEGIYACGDLDVAVLAPDVRPAPGWLGQLVTCMQRDATIGEEIHDGQRIGGNVIDIDGVQFNGRQVQNGGQALCEGRLARARTADHRDPHQSAFNPISAVTSAVSSPNLGAWRRMLLGEPVNFTGGFIRL